MIRETYNSKDISSIFNYSKQLVNKCLRDFAPDAEEYKGKGSLGQLVEELFFGYEINSRQEADFVFVNAEYQKGSKSLKRINKTTGLEYNYSEGAMAFPDCLDRASRTIITGEGGVSPSRFKHIIRTASGRYRRLVPVELERLNMFPDNHAYGSSDLRRAFLMGNALVTGIVENMALVLKEWI